MPLLRSLGLRVLDKYVDSNSLPVSMGVCNEFQSQFDSEGNIQAGYAYVLPEEDYVCRLTKVGTILSKNGKILDFTASPATLADYFGSGSTGYRIDSPNHDSLLLPDDDGNFTVAFWILPYRHAGLVGDVIGKRLTGNSRHRYLLRINGDAPAVVFFAASQDGTTEYSVTCPIISRRWSLVIARCEGPEKKLSLKILSEDGVVTSKSEQVAEVVGCALAGDALVVGRNPDLTSNPLSAGVFYLQQVCVWKKVLSAHEEKELFADGRGVIRWSDPAVPSFFGDFANSEFEITQAIYKKYGTSEEAFIHAGDYTIIRDSNEKLIRVSQIPASSPAAPCKTCDSEPDCYPNAMSDFSPDAISLSVTWTAASGGCVPEPTEFVLHRNQRQIIQGFRFGRTFESDEIALSCGGTLRFFLESTPYHMSQYRYRQYLGIETTFGEKTQIAKFNITMGIALIKCQNFNTGAPNQFFTSPSPSGVNFNFPFSDSFTDYAADIVASGWTDFATVLYEEPFSTTDNQITAACIVANGYRFTVGSDLPEKRGGDCGWQMGVKDRGANVSPALVMDSKYNYRVDNICIISNNPRVVPADPLLNRPFTAVARGLLVIEDEAHLPITGSLPFDPASFTAVMTPQEFVRPEPFTAVSTSARRRFGAGGCIDCDVTASFLVHNLTGVIIPATRRTKIFKTQCPQKTLSGAVSVLGMGAVTGQTTGAGLSRVLGGGQIQANHLTDSEYSDRETSGNQVDVYDNRPLHFGGTLTPSGQMQFTAQIDDYNPELAESLLIDIRPDQKVDPNNPGTYPGTIAGSTKFNPKINADSEAGLVGIQPDHGTLGTVTFGRVPVNSTATITVENCDPCSAAKTCSAKLSVDVNNIVWLIQGYIGIALLDSNIADFECTCFPITTCGGFSIDDNTDYPAPNGVALGDFQISLCDQSSFIAGLQQNYPCPQQMATPALISAMHARRHFSSGSPVFSSGAVSLPPDGIIFGAVGQPILGSNPPVFSCFDFPILPMAGTAYLRCAHILCTTADCDGPAPSYSGIPSGLSGLSIVEIVLKDSASLTRLDSGALRVTLTYRQVYMESDDYTINRQDYWYTASSGSSTPVYQDDRVCHYAAHLVETWDVEFETTVSEDFCLHYSEGDVELAYASKNLISRTDGQGRTIPWTIPEQELLSAQRAGLNSSAGASSAPMSMPALGNFSWQPGIIHASSAYPSPQFAYTCPGPSFEFEPFELVGQSWIYSHTSYPYGDPDITSHYYWLVMDFNTSTTKYFQFASPVVSFPPFGEVVWRGFGGVDASEVTGIFAFQDTATSDWKILYGLIAFGGPFPPTLPSPPTRKFTLTRALKPDGSNCPAWIRTRSPGAYTLDGDPGTLYLVSSFNTMGIHNVMSLKDDTAMDRIITYSPTAAKDSLAFVMPQMIDWSQVVIKLKRESSLLTIGYPTAYKTNLEMSVLGTDTIHELLYDNTGVWRKNFTNNITMVASPKNAVFEIFKIKPGPPAQYQTMARYRLAGFPDQHWNRNGHNQMQLVSADWSIGEWPIYITVEPVV